MQPTTAISQAPEELGLNLAVAFQGAAHCGVLVVNDRLRMTFRNPDAELLLRLKAVVKRATEPVPAPLQKIVRRAFATNLAAAGRITLFGRSRNPVVVHVTAQPLQLQPGKRSAIVLLHDITGGKRLDKSVRQLDRLAGLGVLSAAVTHEIKNALVSVKTFVDLLLEKNRDAELAEVVRREMCRIEALVGQTQKYAAPARPMFSAVRVHEILDHSLRMVRPRLETRLISLNRSFNATPDAVKGDDYQLEQAFVNLLLNAIEAMGPSGSLTVATDLVTDLPSRPKAASATGAHLRIAIADTGAGISSENLRHLFEPFFTTKPQGTGLGLAIARRIVQEHHGDISVESQVNKGTTFNILLPTTQFR